MIWLIIALLFFAAAITFCFIPRGFSALLAFAGMVFADVSGYAEVDSSQLWFWGAAAAIVLAIAVLLPVPVATSRRGVAYVVVGTIAGLMVGMLISANVMVLGGVLGAVGGAVAYASTPAGRSLEFPSRRFVNYLCAKALPPVITLAIISVTVILLMAQPHNNLLT